MATITLPRKEYQELLEKAMRYEYLRQLLAADIFSPPPTRNAKVVLRAFQQTGKYSRQFLKSLEKGLKRSSYFQAQ